MNRKKFLYICLAGGVLFAIPFFFVFGSQIGYPWYWALICLALGLFWAVAFYGIWIIVEKFQKPISFDNPKAQQMLLDYEGAFGQPYEHKFSAFMNYGKGLKQAICETCLYFEKEKIHITFCHFKKIYSFDIPYEKIEGAFMENDNILVIEALDIGCLVFSIKNRTTELRDLFVAKGLYREIIADEKG